MIATLILGCLCGILFAWAWHERTLHLYSRDMVRKALDEAQAGHTLMEEAVATAVKLKGGLETNERLLIAQARVNDDLVREKNELWGLHQSVVGQLGNAQSLLLDEYQTLLRSFNQYRAQHGDSAVQANPTIEQVMQQDNQSSAQKATLQ